MLSLSRWFLLCHYRSLGSYGFMCHWCIFRCIFVGLFSLSLWFVLCHIWSLGSDWCVSCWIILSYIGIQLHKLRCGILFYGGSFLVLVELPSWILFDCFCCMYGVSCWFVLCHIRSFGSNWRVSCWSILGFGGINLYQLRNGQVSGLGGIHCLQCLHCRVILCNRRSIGSDWCVSCWNVFGCIGIYLHKLRSRQVSGFNGIVFLYFMSCRLIL